MIKYSLTILPLVGASSYPFEQTRSSISDIKKTIPPDRFGWSFFSPGRGEIGEEKFTLPNKSETVEFVFDQPLTDFGETVVVTAARKECDSPSPCPANFVLKYMNNCVSTMECRGTNSCSVYETDPLIVDYVFGRLINQALGAGITPNVVGISERYKGVLYDMDSLSGDEVKEMPDFKQKSFLVEDVSECNSSFARVIVEERAGVSLLKGYKALQTISAQNRNRFATRIFIKGLNLLEKIHSIGIIHGDIKIDNLAFEKTETRFDSAIDGDEFDLVLIDFGRASFIMDDIIAAIKEPSELSRNLNAVFFSPWQIEGYPRHFRDDIFRLFAVFIDIVSNGGYISLLSGISGENRWEAQKQIARIMRNFNFVRGYDEGRFDFNLVSGPVGVDLLEEIFTRYPKLEGVDEVVLKQMEEIQSIARLRFPDTKKMIKVAEEVLRNLSEPATAV